MGVQLSRANYALEYRQEWEFLDVEMAGIKYSTCLQIHEKQYELNMFYRTLASVKSQEFVRDWTLRVIGRMREMREQPEA